MGYVYNILGRVIMPQWTPILKDLPCLQKCPNPILTKKDIPYKAEFVFNAGVAKLPSCKKQKEDSPVESDLFALTVENLTAYSIVVSDEQSKILADAVKTLKSGIQKITGVEPTVKSDFIAEGSDVYCESEYEIILGIADRDAVRTVYATSKAKDYGYAMIDSVHAQRQHSFVLDKMILTLIKILFSARSTSTTPPAVRCSVPFLANSIQQKY